MRKDYESQPECNHCSLSQGVHGTVAPDGAGRFLLFEMLMLFKLL